MTGCVVDASVVAAAFFQEDHADLAQRLLAGRQAMHAPDLIYAELANVIWKRHRRDELDQLEAAQLLTDVCSLPLQITSCQSLAQAALELALRTGRSAYDCLYLALAVKTKTIMVTADKRLSATLAAGPLAGHVVWIGELR